MIEIQIKPCCLKCKTPDLEINTTLFQSDMRDIEDRATISCTHQHVCKTYLESGMSYASIRNGFDVK